MEIGLHGDIRSGKEEIAIFMLSFADTMALKCAVELRIADIIHSHGQPITLRQIITSMGSPESADITCLQRIMRFLSHRKIFTVDYPSDGGEMLYGPTQVSKWIIHDAELSLAPLILLETDQRMQGSWQHLSGKVRDGGDAFQKANGIGLWEYMEENPSFSELFNKGMTCNAKIVSTDFSEIYRKGLEQVVGTLVDVGGGTGVALAEIVKAHPQIIGINFDLPHVIATAPDHPGVSHIAGDMFENIPIADTIFMKSVLHDWDDEDCIKILKNCLKSIPGDTGKLIIVETMVTSEASDKLDISLAFDLLMMAHFNGGKERDDREWKELIYTAGFKRINIIKRPLISIIEAYPY